MGMESDHEAVTRDSLEPPALFGPAIGIVVARLALILCCLTARVG